MWSRISTSAEEIVFRPCLACFLTQVATLLIVAAKSMPGALAGDRRWWAGVVLPLAAAMLVSLRYSCQAVIVRGVDLVLRDGWFIARETSIPLWHANLDISQGPLARALGYGTIRRHTRGRTITLRSIARIDDLKQIVARYRTDLIRLAIEQRLAISGQQHSLDLYQLLLNSPEPVEVWRRG